MKLYLDDDVVAHTLGTVIKYREDHQRVEQHGIVDVVKQAITAARARAEAPGQLTISDV